MSDPVFIGVGNRFRRDDGAGPAVIDCLAAAGHRTIEHGGDGAALMDILSTQQNAAIIDATRSGKDPGAIVWIDAVHETLPRDLFNRSTHLFGLAQAIETLRTLGGLPPRLLVAGIEGEDFDMGQGLSAPVARAVETVAGKIASRANVG